ncbi:MAG: oxygen-independent coproporphyrinogen III oxidase [Asticcacaulis sp.]
MGNITPLPNRHASQRSWQEHDALKYLGQEAPRYTSYPSAHHFMPVSAQQYEQWLGQLTPDKSIGLYVHVPFCEQMCYFCGCNTQITRRYAPLTPYVDHLIAEADMVGANIGHRPKVHSLHFGGGSPGILEPVDMGRLFEALHRNFDLAPDAEISIELDPRRVTAAKASTYAALGLNRISLGVQDTQTDVQQAINRIQPIERIRASVDLLRSYGLEALGIDLIYGLPQQTNASLRQTLKEVESLEASRISVFSYAHVPWFKKHQSLIDESTLPSIDDKAGFALLLTEALNAQGYDSIGIDHFAKAGDGLSRALKSGTLRRNFMGYTDMPNDRLIALGASSISELDEGIVQNIPQATTYQNCLAKGQLATRNGWVYGGDDKLRKAIISDLMCYFAADIPARLKQYGYAEDYLDTDIAALRPYVDAGLVTVSNRHVRFHSVYPMLIRSVACTFDLYAQARKVDAGERYSKVV